MGFQHCKRCDEVTWHHQGTCGRCLRVDLRNGTVPWEPNMTPEEQEAQAEAIRVALAKRLTDPLPEDAFLTGPTPPPKPPKRKRTGRPSKAHR